MSERDDARKVMEYDAERIVDKVIQERVDKAIYQLIGKRVKEATESLYDYVDNVVADIKTPNSPRGEVRYFGGSLIHNRQDSSSIDFTAAGLGAITRTAQQKLQDIVSLSDYATVGNYRTARDALTETCGVSTFQVTGSLAVGVSGSTEAVSNYTASVLGTAPSIVIKCGASTGSVALSLFHTGSREYLLKTTTNSGGNFSIGFGTGDGTISTNWLRLIGTSTAIDFGTTATSHFITGTPGTEIVHRIQGDPTNKVCSWEFYRSVDDITNPTNLERLQIISDQITTNTFTIRTDSGGTGTTRDLEIMRGSQKMIVLGTGSLNLDSGTTGPVNLQTNNGTVQFKVVHVASSVNFLQVQGAGTGNNPTLGPTGTDANIDLVMSPKGTGAFKFQTGAFAVNQVWIAHTASANDYLQLTGGVNGSSAPTFSAQGSTNVPLTISTKGSGNLKLDPSTGDIQWNKALVTLGGGSSATLGTIGGSGPVSASQNSWMRVIDSTGAAFWVPAWK